MSHYSIDIHTYARSQVWDDSATKKLGKTIGIIEGKGGPLNCFKGNAIEAAVLISQNKTVEKVIVTHVTETSCGVWRKGKKS